MPRRDLLPRLSSPAEYFRNTPPTYFDPSNFSESTSVAHVAQVTVSYIVLRMRNTTGMAFLQEIPPSKQAA